MLLRCHSVVKFFYRPTRFALLRGISLEVAAGESVAITGPSGGGKSTLLHILGGLEEACEGEVSIAETPLSRTNSAALRNRHLGFIFQDFHLLEELSVLQNVEMPAWIARNKRPLRAPLLLERVGLSTRKDFPVKLLSGGEKQRVSLARALCNDPEILLADEPTGNLDTQTAHEMQSLLLESAKEMGKALVVVTHDGAFAARCDRHYLLREGTLRQL